MKLSVSINYGDRVFTEYELKTLKNGIIADASEAMKEKGDFSGMAVLVSGTLSKLIDETGECVERGFSPIVDEAPIQTIEEIALRILTMDDEDGQEQIAICPRCKNKRIYEDEDSIKFEDLEIMEHQGDQIIHVDLQEAVEIKQKGGNENNPLLKIENIDFRFPLIKDGKYGHSKVPSNKDVRRSYATFGSSIISVNGNEVEDKFRKTWGLWVLERMSRNDLKEIQKVINSCGIKKSIERECLVCGKKWNAPVDLSGFFVSGLQR